MPSSHPLPRKPRGLNLFTHKCSDRWIYIGWSATYCLVIIYIASVALWPDTACMLINCPIHNLTGYNCPTCGLTRACISLLHGEILTALHQNILVIPAAIAALLFPLLLLLDLLTGASTLPSLHRRIFHTGQTSRKTPPPPA